MSKTLELIQAIKEGNSRLAQAHFESEVQTRVSNGIDSLRGEISSTMFGTNESVSELTEADLDEMSDEDFNELVENYEQLDELSRDTMWSYATKASSFNGNGRSLQRLKQATDISSELGDSPEKTKALRDAAKVRETGLSRARTKIERINQIKTRDAALKKDVPKEKSLFGKIKSKIHRLTAESIDEASDEDFNELIENYEQLDELSKATLASYVKKSKTAKNGLHATYNAANAADRIGHPDTNKLKQKYSNRYDGVDSARKKLSDKEAKEIVDGYNKPEKKSLFGKIKSKIHRLTAESIDEASDEDFNELVENYEQLDELSKGTLASYVKRAHHSGGMAAFRQGKALGNAGAYHKHPKRIEADKEAFTSTKRELGVNKAVNRLSK